MSWAIILEILWKIIQQRNGAGWPWLIKFLDRFWKKVETDVAAIRASDAPAILAAPDELKTMLVELFTELRANAGVFMKAVYSLLIQIVPALLDKVWDKLFEAGHVTVSFASFSVMAASEVSADEMIEAVDCE